ncbi:MAG: hypothetical protein AAF725_14580 [Acidobacteriota bacterium]
MMRRLFRLGAILFCLFPLMAAPATLAQQLEGPGGGFQGPGGEDPIDGPSDGGGGLGGGGGDPGGELCFEGSLIPCCGDGVCSPGELCAVDCAVCGDGLCSGTESCFTCSSDCGPCPSCGDGVCNGRETCATCSDCTSCFNAPIQAFYRGETTENVYRAYSFSGTTWFGNVVLGNGARSSRSPAAVRFNDRIFVFYRGQENDDIYVSWSDDGISWLGNRVLGNGAETDAGLGAAVFNNRIYVFSKGESDEALWVSSSSDGFTWSPLDHVRLAPDAQGTRGAPSAVVFENRLFVYYSNEIIVRSLSTGDGQTWRQESVLSFAAADGVGLTVHNGDLYMAFSQNLLGSDSFLQGINLRVASRSPGGAWSTPRSIGPERTDQRPSLISDGTQLVMMFKGLTSNKNFFSTSVDGVNWSAARAARGKTETGGPSMVFVD